ncbi:MAG TPA: TetR/AcrR family transcriptional regulator [Bacteroidetes bacterium]|nr:TetR/AcrR family transcriptional regulator [Bacteroidota bacterium]
MARESKKHKDIITTARELFWKHGFKRMSVEEICRKANVSKMTYYKYFPNKIELAKTMFNNVVEEGEKQFRMIMKEDSTAAEKLEKIILLKMEGTNSISPEFLQDFYTGSEPELKAFVEERTKKTWDLLINDFKEAQEAGIFRKDFKPEFMVIIQNMLIGIIEDENITAMFDTRQELIMEFVNLIIYGIAPRE